MSRIWSSHEILIFSINRFIKRDQIFCGRVLYKLIVQDTPIHISPHERFVSNICNNYKVDCIDSVMIINHPTLSIYYRPFKLLIKHDLFICQPHIIQDCITNTRFFIQRIILN